MSLTFMGLGLNDEKGITLEGLEEARLADSAYGEFYTNIMPNLDLKRLEKEIGKKVEVLSRSQLEDEGGENLLRAASKESVAFLVPGRSEEHTSELQSLTNLVCRLLLE